MPAVRSKSSKTKAVLGGHESSAGVGETIVIKGRKLRTTSVFDTFWKYTAERQAIYERRQMRLPAPWTDDIILQRAHFCNIFRVSDRGSQFLIREVIDTDSQEPVEVIFRVLLYNIFSRPETYLYLKDYFGGSLTWAAFDHNAYMEALQLAYDRKVTLYTSAFQKPAPSLGHKVAHLNHVELLMVMMEKNLPEKFAQWKGDEGMRDAYIFFRSFPGMGDFLAYQLLLDLSYTPFLDFVSNNFVTPGHGAVSGLRKCFTPSKELSGIEADVILWMATTQEEQFKKRWLQFDGLDGQVMRVWDIEHTLCEVDKYSRKVHPGVKGDLGRTALKSRGWIAQSDEIAEGPTVFPRAWDEWRKKSPSETRVQLEQTVARSVDKIEKQYVISGILDERIDDGEREYLVEWQGYSRSDSTWEPESLLLNDAPKVVQAYQATNRRRERPVIVKKEEPDRINSRRKSSRVKYKTFKIKSEEEEVSLMNIRRQSSRVKIKSFKIKSEVEEVPLEVEFKAIKLERKSGILKPEPYLCWNGDFKPEHS